MSNHTAPTATVDLEDGLASATVKEPRPEVLAMFGELTAAQRDQLAVDAWVIGMRAVANAHAQAQEARLADIGRTLLQDVGAQLDAHVQSQQQAIASALQKYFDPADGQVTERLRAFADDQGSLARLLERFVGARNSVLAETLAKQVGEQSLLFKKLNPTDSEGLIKALEAQLDQVLARNHRDLQRALDPLAEDGAVARFLKQLSVDLATANQGQASQLAAALAALDANDEASLINRLARETAAARESLLRALNPQDPASPLAAIESSLRSLLEKQSLGMDEFQKEQRERQAELETQVREALARLETRRQADATSPRGGLAFEKAVSEVVVDAVRGAPLVVSETGNSVGARRACKKGDMVLRYSEEHAFAGAALTIEAKRDASYTVPKALAELDEARANREASAGLFVMAASHAPGAFPRLARYGQNVLVCWDDSDPSTDPYLEAGLMLALFLVSRNRAGADAGDLTAMRDVEERIQAELARLAKMEKCSDGIRRHNDELADELRKARNQFDLLLKKAKATLMALNVELVDEALERSSPLALLNCSAGIQ
ncbi:MAG: hypothetical protein KC464_27000 [Myxococcales bacterium]|nr:hypothetical protein [Myxococcales bacterium]